VFLPIPTSGQRSDVVFSGLPKAGAGLLFRNVGPETKALGFSNAINFPALWTCRQDGELVIDNQGFWFRRRCERCLNIERPSCFIPRKAKTARDRPMPSGSPEMPHCGNSVPRAPAAVHAI
jgi:hypothetical protein